MVYTYVGDYNSLDSLSQTAIDAKSKIVDSYGATGYYLTLDVAKNSDGTKTVPYIGYYSGSLLKPKYAYLVGSATEAGANDKDMYTGKWESMYIPSKSEIDATENIQIGVYKDSDGKIQAIPVKSGTDNPADTSRTYHVGGNNTDNPIIAYLTSYSGNGCIETAQLK